MANQVHIIGQFSMSTPSSDWRRYVAAVRADAVEAGSAEVARFMLDNSGEFSTEAEAVDAYRADHAFLCPILNHWFRFEDGVELSDGTWIHVDARDIGHSDAAFDYGRPDKEIKLTEVYRFAA